jgi:hypothetical protein
MTPDGTVKPPVSTSLSFALMAASLTAFNWSSVGTGSATVAVTLVAKEWMIAMILSPVDGHGAGVEGTGLHNETDGVAAAEVTGGCRSPASV